MRRIRLIAGLFVLALAWMTIILSAQNRPGNFSTLNTTDTSTSSTCIGCVVGAAMSTAAGTVNAQKFALGTTSTGAAGQLYYNAVSGSSLYSRTGSSNDFTLLNPAGTGVLSIPTGTTTIAVSGFTVTGGTIFGGATVMNGVATMTLGDNIGSSNITDSVFTPSVSSCGGATIAGRDFAFVINNILATSCTMAFNATYANPPACVLQPMLPSNPPSISSVSTTQLIIGLSAGTGQTLYGQCRGY